MSVHALLNRISLLVHMVLVVEILMRKALDRCYCYTTTIFCVTFWLHFNQGLNSNSVWMWIKKKICNHLFCIFIRANIRQLSVNLNRVNCKSITNKSPAVCELLLNKLTFIEILFLVQVTAKIISLILLKIYIYFFKNNRINFCWSVYLMWLRHN